MATPDLPPAAGPAADDPQLGGLVMLGNPTGVKAKPAVLWRFTPGA